MKNFSSEWEKLTSDDFILDVVNHCHIEFSNNEKPIQNYSGIHSVFNKTESEFVAKEIKKLLEWEAIKVVEPTEGQFLSPIFLRPKKNGDFRMILNLKRMNEYIEYHHFKMDTFENAIKLITKDTFMASIDLKNAYHTVSIAEEHQKYLRFQWNGKIFQYTCLPFGISSAPRIFTKLMKPVYSKLRALGFVNIGYIDDSLLCGDSIEACDINVKETIKLLSSLGFFINKEKSVLSPTKKIVFLGHIIDSEQMIVYLTDDKKFHILTECKQLMLKNTAKIRHVAKVIGLIVSSFSAVEFGKLFYRNLENEKIRALKNSAGNYDTNMTITYQMKIELEWWVANVNQEIRKISHGNPEITIETDASMLGWGAIINEIEIGGRWTEQECHKHINYLEILAIFMAFKSFLHLIQNKHVKVLTDNTTAVSYISNMGGTKSKDCNEITKKIWLLCRKNSIWITCSHVAGKINVLADKKSREFDDKLEWKLDINVFKKLCFMWGNPEIDLFASRLNFQIDPYCAWKPDPGCSFVNAFSINWKDFNYVYLFPPFSLLGRCICKLKQDRAKGIVIAPLWLTQAWFPRLMELLTDVPIMLPRKSNLLVLPHDKTAIHPLHKNLVLIACQVSGCHLDNEGFLQKQQTYSCRLGNQVLGSSIKYISKNGFSIVSKDKLISFKQL